MLTLSRLKSRSRDCVKRNQPKNAPNFHDALVMMANGTGSILDRTGLVAQRNV